MKLSEAEVRELFQRKTARDASRSEECLGEDALIRASNGTLDAAERERVAAHIARCSDCAREFRIVRSLAPLESETRRQFPEPRHAPAWLAVAASIVLALTLPALLWLVFARKRDARTIDELRNRPPVVQTVPAPPAEDVSALRTIIAELSRPQLDVPIVDLDADVVRGASDPAPTINVPRTADGITLILHLPEPTGAPVDIEILDANGRVQVTEGVSAREGRSSVTLVLRRKILSEGTHVIRLTSQKKTSTFQFRVDYP